MANSPFKNYSTLKIASNDDQNGYQLFAAFNSYQKSRMDFLADVTFGEPTIETTKMVFSEVMRDLDKNRILLENISGTSDFNYKFVIRNLTNCRNKKDEPCLEECNCCIVNNKTQKEKDIAVSIPNDILGCHAFYLILENIIRNCAKHGIRKDDIKIYIDFDDCKREDDYYKLHIYDNSEPEKLDELVEKQNKSLNRNILEGNKLRQGGWGLIEMEAAAAYLRKHPLEDINEDDFEVNVEDSSSIYPVGKEAETQSGKPNFLKAVKVHNYYGYRLFLLKPKELLIVYDEKAEEIINQIAPKKGELRKNGIKFVKIDEFHDEALKRGVIYSYPILIFAGTKEHYKDKIKSNESSLPIRQLVCLTDAEYENSRFSFNLSQENFSKVLKQSDVFKILNEVWKAWILRQFNYLGIKINNKTFFSVINAKSNAKEIALMNDGADFVELIKDNDPSVSFDSHAIENCEKICSDIEDVKSYAEPYNSKDYFLIRKLITRYKDYPERLAEKDFQSLLRLIECTGTTIHIIDERIQELAERTPYKPERGKQQTNNKTINEIQYIDLLYATHVIIPYSGSNEFKFLRKTQESEQFNLNAKDFTPIRDKIIIYLRSIIKTTDSHSHTKAKADFLLLHLGVVEKLISSDSDKTYDKEKQIKEFIQNEILEGKKNVDTKIIFISGRGKPHNLPEDFLYLNFSIVAQYCIENRLKYYLNDVVHSAKHI